VLVDVVEVRAVGGHRLFLRFADGVAGEVDLDRLVRWTGVFESLRDPRLFAQARVDAELGTVAWPGGADLDPDVLYAVVTGRPIALSERAARR
jgi:hypothetical protein